MVAWALATSNPILLFYHACSLLQSGFFVLQPKQFVFAGSHLLFSLAPFTAYCIRIHKISTTYNSSLLTLSTHRQLFLYRNTIVVFRKLMLSLISFVQDLEGHINHHNGSW